MAQNPSRPQFSRRQVIVGGAVFGAALALPPTAATAVATTLRRTLPIFSGSHIDFIKRTRLGLFTHYTYGDPNVTYGWTYSSPAGSRVASVDALANALDVTAFADVAAGMGAEYVTFTIWHAGMNMVFPSTVMGSLIPSKVSSRDLVADLLEALGNRNIRMIGYVHPMDGFELTASQQALVGWGNYTNWNNYINALFDEMGTRYGASIAGYWIDGSVNDAVIDGSRLEATIRSHNPTVAVWTNDGSISSLPDFANIEIFTRPSMDTDAWPTDTAQVCQRFAGEWWAQPGQALGVAASDMLRFTVREAGTFGQQNGGIHWAAGPYADNTWGTGVETGMRALGTSAAAIGESLFGSFPSTSFVTLRATVQSSTWGVATDSADGNHVYAHVLNGTPGSVLSLGAPKDRRTFSATAHFVPSGTAIGVAPDLGGRYLLDPPASIDPTDTVIKLDVSGAPVPWDVAWLTVDAGSWSVPVGGSVRLRFAGGSPTSDGVDFDSTRLIFHGYDPSVISFTRDGDLRVVGAGSTDLTVSCVTAIGPDELTSTSVRVRYASGILQVANVSGAFVTAVDTSASALRNDVTLASGAGFKMTVRGSSILVDELGRYFNSGNHLQHELAVYSASGTKLTSTTIDMSVGSADATGFKYAKLPTPIRLAANTVYYLSSVETAGGDTWWNSETTTTFQSAWATVNLAALGNGGSAAYGIGHMYGPVSFKLASSPSARSFVTAVDNSASYLRNDVTLASGAGFEMTVGSVPITVSELGRYFNTGNHLQHELAIYNAAGTKLASTVVDMSVGVSDATGFKWATLSMPIQLAASTVYYVSSLENSGGDTWWNSQTATRFQSSWATMNLASLGNGTSQAFGVGHSYGAVNFKLLAAPAATSTSFVQAVDTSDSYLRNDVDLATGAGFQMTVGSSAITVTHLGRFFNRGNYQVHEVAIRNTAGTKVASATVDMGAGVPDATGFKYATLATPVVLAANTVYYVSSVETAGGDTWWNSQTVTQFASNKATANLAALGDGGSPAYGVGHMYGPVSMKIS